MIAKLRSQAADTSRVKTCSIMSAKSSNQPLRRNGFKNRNESIGSRTNERKKSKSKSVTSRQYDEQSAAINAMRGMLEEENNRKRADMMKAIQQENIRLALEKKQREEDDNDWNQAMNTREIFRDD